MDPAKEIADALVSFRFTTKLLIFVPILFALVLTLTALQQEARLSFSSEAARPRATSETVSLSPSSLSTRVGSNFNVSIKVNTMNRINAAEVVLNYPPETFEVTGVTVNTDAFDVTVANNFGGGRIHLIVGSTKPVTGDTVIANVNVKPLTKARARIQFGAPVSFVSFDTNLNIPVTTINGMYTIR